MLVGSQRLLLKLALVAAMVVFVLSFHPKTAAATCSYGNPGPNCSASCYNQVYCEAIDCFHQSWASGGNGQECCFYNNEARFCGSGCPLFCATP